ncbi:MAG: hypothetical protein COB45_03270 [Gammaproteobacteria bacterium]|nr:MAG: hypothetical protein COB45_03270 [Gammaproteobacteria bacterium]PHR83879.1 MAG: hypothetical protein COA59_09540 [Colwellia sp.]
MNSNTNKVIVTFLLTFSLTLQANNEKWNFSLTPYGWFAGFEGLSGTFENLPPLDVNISPSDALNDSDSSFMLIAEAKKGKHGIYTDYFYSNSLYEEDIFPNLGVSFRSRTKTTMITLAYEREIFKDTDTSFELLAGARWWQINSALTFKFPNPVNNRSIKSTEQWLDPYVGIKGRTYIENSSFYLAGALSIGGFGINSDFFYDTNINIGYQWTPTIGTAIGYRQYELDYENNSFIYDVKQAGLQVDLTWKF